MAGLPAEKRGAFTFTDYLTWPEGERWEIIGGEAFDMSPTPLTRHQYVATRLAGLLEAFLKGHRCRLWVAPMAVKLSDHDVVEPDLFVVCNPAQVKRTHIEGPPTLVIEILSDRTKRHDRATKLKLYEQFGVKEYWLVDPYPSLIEVFLLEGNHFRLHSAHEKHETLRSPTFPKLRIKLSAVFDFPLEPGEEAIRMVRESCPPYGTAKRLRPAPAR